MTRRWHLLTAVVATVALALQLALVVGGGAVLDEVTPPALPVRLARFVAYFTIQSNLLVAVSVWWLVREPDAGSPWFRVVRLAGVAGITVTGLVHFVLLRPLLDLDGADRAADTLLHLVVPLLVVVGWLVLGPRDRVDRTALGAALAWPVAWLVVTLTVGATTGWYPYPFLDPGEDGVGAVVVACVGITVLFLVVLGALAVLDRRLPRRADSPA